MSELGRKGWDKSEEGTRKLHDEVTQQVENDVRELAEQTDIPRHTLLGEFPDSSPDYGRAMRPETSDRRGYPGIESPRREFTPAEHERATELDMAMESGELEVVASPAQLDAEAPGSAASWLGQAGHDLTPLRLSQVPSGSWFAGEPVHAYVDELTRTASGMAVSNISTIRSDARARLERPFPRPTLVHWHRADAVCPLEPDGATVEERGHEMWISSSGPAHVGPGYVARNVEVQVWVPSFDNAPWDIVWSRVREDRLTAEPDYVQVEPEETIEAYPQRVFLGQGPTDQINMVTKDYTIWKVDGDKLAKFINENIPCQGLEPSTGRTAVEDAIELLRKAYCNPVVPHSKFVDAPIQPNWDEVESDED